MASAQLFDDLYKEVILDHSRHPRNTGRLPAPALTAEGVNPVCGDAIRLDLALDGARIAGAAFEGQGCAISQASASLLTEHVAGATVAEARATLAGVRAMLVDGAEPGTDLGDLAALQGVAKFPVRVKCAMLAWKLLEGLLDTTPPQEGRHE
jgi:nitrogen fixation NifU-like protein